MNSTSANGKRIFISDIHMGPEGKVSPYPHHYGWLRDNITPLANFLNDQLKAEDLGQVVILGDLFDQWVIPTDLDPLPGLKDICDNLLNKDVIDGLQRLAGGGKLSYVPGNHDMSPCPEDMTFMKEFLEARFSGINLICEEDQPIGVYRDGDLVAEHGNRYCLFNAPDLWTDPANSFLPLGYFISRVVAYEVARTGHRENYWDIFCKFEEESRDNPNFISDVFLAIADDAELKESDKINMGNIGGFGPWITIGEVASRYMSLKENWDKGDHKIGSTLAMLGDCPLGLLDAAYKVYLGPDTDENIKIVIFGHTHTRENESSDPLDECEDDPSQPCKAIYANSGAWVDSADSCTYVETQIDEGSQRHYVRVKSYPENELMRQLFVAL